MNFNFPASPPVIKNLAVVSLTSESVTLNWTRPATNCPISQYFVSHSGSVLWNNGTDEKSLTVEGDITEKNITGLTPYTNYTFCVVANNDVGNGTEECVEDIVTLEGCE